MRSPASTNRGTKARGPLQYFTSISVNNLGRMHESFTLSYAGAFQTTSCNTGCELPAGAHPEGLTFFANNSYSRSKPGTEILQTARIQDPAATCSSGLELPVHPQPREEPDRDRAVLMSNDRSDILGALNTLDRIRGVRLKVDCRLRRSAAATNQINVVLSQGIEGLGGSPGGHQSVAGQRRARLHQGRGDRQPAAAPADSRFFRTAGGL
jgi:hypothetical protein